MDVRVSTDFCDSHAFSSAVISAQRYSGGNKADFGYVETMFSF